MLNDYLGDKHGVVDEIKDAWLKSNTFSCKRLDARITREMCQLYRSTHQDRKIKAMFNHSVKMLWRGRCQGCSQAKGKPIKAAKRRVNSFTGQLETIKEK
jgi:hypothetical protein